jgi:flagellar protein FliO/FliZ
MKFLAGLLAAAVPGAAFAGDQGSAAGFSLAGGIFQMLASLAIVVGVIILFRHFANRLLKGGLSERSAPSYIRVVENRFLAPKKSLMLVEVGGEYLLLGSTGDGINLIKQIDMLESIEVVEDLAQPPRPAFSVPDTLRNLSGLLRKRGGVCFPLWKRMV